MKKKYNNKKNVGKKKYYKITRLKISNKTITKMVTKKTKTELSALKKKNKTRTKRIKKHQNCNVMFVLDFVLCLANIKQKQQNE